MNIISKTGLKIVVAILAVLALWMLWGIAKKVFWLGVFLVVAYMVFKLVRSARRR